ncbi:unnamed protein product [Prorocentrum cordatum]|uniref:Peroxisomal membrane protein PEX16 n=1 Tax=Prorocentrum cordatum TaxID=2364126 RepID=A0ABN9YG35_9DINO|nr:unnamed protein product [Polarella glacialis]
MLGQSWVLSDTSEAEQGALADWKLTHDALEQLVAAVSFFSGLHALLGLLEQYPSAPWLHEVACKVLVGDAEHQDMTARRQRAPCCIPPRSWRSGPPAS